MNIIDLAVIGVLVICVAVGYYRGFFISLLDLCAVVLCTVISLLFYRVMARGIAGESLRQTLFGFTESSDIIGSIEVYRTSVVGMDASTLSAVLERLNLPYPLAGMLGDNIRGAVYATHGYVYLGDYLGMTIVDMSLCIIGYMMFFGISLVLSLFIIRTVAFVREFPVLKRWDSLSGALFGLLFGVGICFTVFMAAPVMMAFLPFQELQYLLDGSVFAGFFYKSNLLLGQISSFLG